MPREYYVYPNGTSIAVAGNNEYATQIPMSVSDATDVYTAINAKVSPSDLATVATTGSYNDLSNKPNLATVATSGSYNDLSNKPTIPDISTKVSKSGDTMTGQLTLQGYDLVLAPYNSSSNDSADIQWRYGNNNEKMRIWTSDTYTTAVGPNYRVYKSDGTNLYNGYLALGNSDGSARAVAWGSVSGKPARYPTYYLDVQGDTRSTATAPNDYGNKFTFCGLKTNTVINSPSSDIYSYVIGLRGWNDASGGQSWELAFNNSGIYARTQNGSNNSWKSWQRLGLGLTYVASTTGSTAKNFTIPSNASEIIITAYMSGINKLFSSSVPWSTITQSTSISYEFWVGGGKNEESSGNGGAARAVCQIQRSSATNLYLKGVAANNAGTATLSSTTWGVYYR